MKFKLFSVLVAGLLLTSSLQAGWMVVNEDGTSAPLASCCGKKVATPKKVAHRKVKAPKACKTCDFSQFPDAQLLPVGDERLAPADLRGCNNK